MSFFLIIILSIFLIMWGLLRIIPLFIMRGHKGKKRKEGEVFVSQDSNDRQEKIVDKGVGEYVDYETIKEEKE